jgi:hypothetical protein
MLGQASIASFLFSSRNGERMIGMGQPVVGWLLSPGNYTSRAVSSHDPISSIPLVSQSVLQETEVTSDPLHFSIFSSRPSFPRKQLSIDFIASLSHA